MVLSGLSSGAESFSQFLTVIFVFLLVLALTYLTTRFVGSFQKSRAQNCNFEVIETYKITNGKYLQIVKVGGKYIVIGIGKNEITNICELDEDRLKLTEDDKAIPVDAFKNIMEKARERIGKGGKENEK